MNDDQTTQPQTDEVETDVKGTTADPSTAQAEQQAPPAESTVDVAADLVKSLAEGTFDAPTEESKPEPEKAETPVEEPIVEKTVAETPEEDDEDDDNLEIDPKFTRIRKGFDRLREKAKFGNLITKIGTDAQIAPEEMASWVSLAARLKRGDPKALGDLIETAKVFGYEPPTQQQRAPEPSIEDKIYAEQFAADVESGEISEAAARRHAKVLAEKLPQSKQVEQPRTTKSVDPVRESALHEISSLETSYTKTIPNWSKISEKASKRLVEEYASKNPIYWAAGYEKIVQEEIRALQPQPKSQTSIKPVAGTQVRPTSSTTQARQVAPTTRDEIVQGLLSGAFSKP
jgi:hypothetical protein